MYSTSVVIPVREMFDEFENITESESSAVVDVFWRVKILSNTIFNDDFVESPDFAETEVFPVFLLIMKVPLRI